MIREQVRNIELSIRKISEKAKEQEDCVRFDIGQPSFDTPEHVKQAAIEGMEQQQGYTSTLGMEELREKIVEEEALKKGVRPSRDQTLVTVGGMGALYAIFACRLGDKDKAVFNDPCWGPYKLISSVNGNRFEQVEYWDEDRELNPELRQELEDAEMMIVNSPSNPSGRVLTKKQAKEIAEVAEDTGTFLVSDEVYHGLVFDREHHSPYQYCENSAIIGSTSKNHAMTGWRIGWVVDSAENIKNYAKATRGMTASPPKISQLAAIEALRDRSHLDEMVREYEERRDIVVERMNDLGWEFVEPDGAIYTFPEVGKDSWDYCLRMVEEGVAMVPGEPFGPESDQNIRICFGSTTKDRIRKAFEIIEDET